MTAAHGVFRTLAIAALACLLAPPADARTIRVVTPTPGLRELLIENRSESVIQELYVAEASAAEWGSDQLGGSRVDPGGTVRLHLGQRVACRFDIQAVFTDGRREDALDFDLCRNPRTAFAGTATVPPAGLATPSRSLRLTNHGSRPIALAFVSSGTADAWGDDRLDGTVIAPGDSRDIAFHGECSIDLRVVFDNRAAEERRSFDVCARPVVDVVPGWTTAEPPQPAFAAGSAPAR